MTGAGNETRGLFFGGATGPATNIIEYITFKSTGNAADFGDLSSGRMELLLYLIVQEL
jgi:hypothetical protein